MNSLCEGAAELFNDGICEYFASHTLDFRLRLLAAEPAIERKLEIFSLADLFQAFVTHPGECAMNGLSLWIKDALLERNINVGFHGRVNYTSGLRKVYHDGLGVKPDHHWRMARIVV